MKAKASRKSKDKRRSLWSVHDPKTDIHICSLVWVCIELSDWFKTLCKDLYTLIYYELLGHLEEIGMSTLALNEKQLGNTKKYKEREKKLERHKIKRKEERKT